MCWLHYFKITWAQGKMTLQAQGWTSFLSSASTVPGASTLCTLAEACSRPVARHGGGDYHASSSFQMSLCLSCRELFNRYLWQTVVIFRSSITFVTISLKFIAIIRHELGLNRHVAASSNSPFKDFLNPLHLFRLYLSIFLACCCSFLLHVVANLASRQLVLLSSVPKFLHSFLWSKGSAPLFFWKLLTRLCQSSFYPFYTGQNFVSV